MPKLTAVENSTAMSSAFCFASLTIRIELIQTKPRQTHTNVECGIAEDRGLVVRGTDRTVVLHFTKANLRSRKLCLIFDDVFAPVFVVHLHGYGRADAANSRGRVEHQATSNKMILIWLNCYCSSSLKFSLILFLFSLMLLLFLFDYIFANSRHSMACDGILALVELVDTA